VARWEAELDDLVEHRGRALLGYATVKRYLAIAEDGTWRYFTTASH
jgi:hypothetical protein